MELSRWQMVSNFFQGLGKNFVRALYAEWNRMEEDQVFFWCGNPRFFPIWEEDTSTMEMETFFSDTPLDHIQEWHQSHLSCVSLCWNSKLTQLSSVSLFWNSTCRYLLCSVDFRCEFVNKWGCETFLSLTVIPCRDTHIYSWLNPSYVNKCFWRMQYLNRYVGFVYDWRALPQFHNNSFISIIFSHLWVVWTLH